MKNLNLIILMFCCYMLKILDIQKNIILYLINGMYMNMVDYMTIIIISLKRNMIWLLKMIDLTCPLRTASCASQDVTPLTQQAVTLRDSLRLL